MTDEPTGSDDPGTATTDDERATSESGVLGLEDYRRRSRRSFLGLGTAGLGAYLGFRHVQNRPESDNIPDIVRRGLEFNEAVWTTVGSDTRTSRTYAIDDREPIRVNGQIGLRSELDADAWTLTVASIDGDVIDRLGLADVQALPVHDMVWEHKCIEGWANIVHWTGARLRDLIDRYEATGAVDGYRYLSLRTPDEAYYVGLDRETARHSQTLLAWALNGEELTEGHGAPLRLATPVTYGIKQLKRVGTIQFTRDRPADYWAERGYDWHARF